MRIHPAAGLVSNRCAHLIARRIKRLRLARDGHNWHTGKCGWGFCGPLPLEGSVIFIE